MLYKLGMVKEAIKQEQQAIELDNADAKVNISERAAPLFRSDDEPKISDDKPIERT